MMRVLLQCMLLITFALVAHAEDSAPSVPSHKSAASEYKMGPGDEIRIIVLAEKDLTLDFILSDAGTISYPFLGEIRVRGLTVSELEKIISKRLSEGFIVDPVVNVQIAKYRQFFINGEVREPGGYPYQPGLTVHMAVALAGGFTERAARRSIVVIHEDDPSHEPQDIDLNDRVQPGDIVLVEESFF